MAYSKEYLNKLADELNEDIDFDKEKLEELEKYIEENELHGISYTKNMNNDFIMVITPIFTVNNFGLEDLLQENYTATKEKMKGSILSRLEDDGFNLSDFENFEELEEALYEARYLSELEFEELTFEGEKIYLNAKKFNDVDLEELKEKLEQGLTPEEVDGQTEAYKVYKEALEELKEEWKQELDYKNTNNLKL